MAEIRGTGEANKSRDLLPRKHTEIHGRKDESKIVMATESTEEHGKIKPIIISALTQIEL